MVDWHTGLAIGGYDPVAFFTDGKPVPGSPISNCHYGGAVWRFRNVGNRAAFAAQPDVYMPQFGGYDPVGVARGVAVAGNPDVWLISGERLFLFYDRAGCDNFAANAERIAERGRAQMARGAAHPQSLTTFSQPRDRAVDRRRVAPGEKRRNATLAACRRRAARRPAAITLPPAAARIAWPAATSQSCVGASRG